jgi:DNA-binding response OmpR family regulator
VSKCNFFYIYNLQGSFGVKEDMDKPFKLLIIDDNEEILNSIYNFFNKKKYDVVSASDGLDGLKILEAEKDGFDLVITDIVMPHISGVGVISIVKNKYPEIPVVAITGWGKHPEELALEKHADLVFEKPFELAELEKSVRNILTQKKCSK